MASQDPRRYTGQVYRERNTDPSPQRRPNPKPQESMYSWLERQASSHQAQLAATAIFSGIAVAGTIYGVQAVRRKEAVEELKASIPELNEEHRAELLNEFGAPSNLPKPSDEDERAAALARRAQNGDYDEELIQEQLTRTASFLGPERFSLLRDAFVIVIGLGGVGSHCASALARSGVSKIRLVDFDQVTLSSLNRHAVATLSDVGTPKVHCVRNRLRAIAPWVQWDCHNELFSPPSAERLLAAWDQGRGRKPDYIVDAIDNIDSKVSLLSHCHSHALPILSSMGAGCKSDPTRIGIGDISASTEDPLSRVTRRRLRALGIASGIPVIYSTEKPGPGKAELLPLPDDEFRKGNTGELSILPDFRARILPVLGTMPAVFGCTAANYVMLEFSGYPHEVSGAGGNSKNRDKLYEQILSSLQGMEERLLRDSLPPGGGIEAQGIRLPLSKDDVGYLVEEVFRGKSVVSGIATRLVLVRWERPERGFGEGCVEVVEGQRGVALGLGELVCMTKEEGGRHEREVLRGGKAAREVWGESVEGVVRARRGEEAWFARFR